MDDLDNPNMGYKQALQYGKDLARLFKTEKAERQKFETLFNLSPDGVIIVNQECDIHAANPAMKTMIGVSPTKTLKKRNLKSLVLPEYFKDTLSIVQETIEEISAYRRQETQFISKNGTKFPVEINMGRIIWDQKPAVQIIVRDITESKQTMELLENKVAKRTQILSVMYSVAAIGNESQDIEHILSRSLDFLLEAIQAPTGLILIRNQNFEGKEIKIYQGADSKEKTAINVWIEDKKIWQKIFTGDDAATNLKVDIDHLGQKSIFSVPIRADGKTLGVLLIIRRVKKNDFEEELGLCKSVAAQIGNHVQSSRFRASEEQAAVLEERNRLARDLHDSISQLLYSLTLFATAGLKFLKLKEFQRVDQYLIRLNETAERALKEMRILIFELRPISYNENDLVGAINHRLKLVELRAGINASLTTKKWESVPNHIFSDTYGIIQESLNNSLKHAKANHVWIDLYSDGKQIRIEIKDDGIGFDYDKVKDSGGMGLVNIKERSQNLDANLIIESQIDVGTTISLSIDLNDQSSAKLKYRKANE